MCKNYIYIFLQKNNFCSHTCQYYLLDLKLRNYSIRQNVNVILHKNIVLLSYNPLYLYCYSEELIDF